MPYTAATLLGVMVVTLASVSTSRGQTVDWKLYGGSDVGGESVCFYDANGVSRTADQHVRAWTKCLPKSELDNIDFRKAQYDDIAKLAAREIVKGYVPPIVVSGLAKFDKIVDFASMEAMADLAEIKPASEILLELNCSEHMIRELSIHITSAGREGFNEHPTPWSYFPPDSNGARLQRLLCTSEPLGR